MYEFNSKQTKQPDALFMERLDAFLAKCLADIKAFSERELRPFEETRQYVAEWHNKYLFQTCVATALEVGASVDGKAGKVRPILCETSRILETLYESAGVQSFLVAVDPLNPSDDGFLGGSEGGREFWRGFRGGGSAGVKAFKTQCLRNANTVPPKLSITATFEQGTASPVPLPSTPPVPVPAPSPQPIAKPATAKATKTELYDTIRKTLRATSGVRNAEMKWTNPERLDIYGVRLVGWPDDIPKANPSTLKQGQNRRLLDLVESKQLRFEAVGNKAEVAVVEREQTGSQELPSSSRTSQTTQDERAQSPVTGAMPVSPRQPMQPVAENHAQNQVGTEPMVEDFDDLSWAYDFDKGALPTHQDDQGQESPVIHTPVPLTQDTTTITDQRLISTEETGTEIIGHKRRRSDFDTESSDSDEEGSSSSFSS